MLSRFIDAVYLFHSILDVVHTARRRRPEEVRRQLATI